MRRLLQFLLFITLLYFAHAANAVADPGSREDVTPWFGLGSLENKIIDLLDKVADTQQEMAEALNRTQGDYEEKLARLQEKQRNAKKVGWPLITDSKSDYQEKIEATRKELGKEKQDVRTDYEKQQDKLAEEIKNALASPPASAEEKRMELVRKGTPTREAHEVYNALVNLRDSVLELNKRLAAERTNYDLASTTYKAQIQLYRYTIQMNEEFRQRIDQVYKPRMKDLEKRITAALKNTAASPMDEARKEREEQKLERIQTALREGYPKLERHKEWAGRNIDRVQHLLKINQTLLENVEIAGDAAALVADVNAEIQQLDFVPPELIEYDLEASDFEFPEAVEAEKEE